jgi:hypothetical protein
LHLKVYGNCSLNTFILVLQQTAHLNIKQQCSSEVPDKNDARRMEWNRGRYTTMLTVFSAKELYRTPQIGPEKEDSDGKCYGA